MLVAVAVPVPYLNELTYRVPAGMPVPPVGARVRVPIGSRMVVGCVVALDVPAIEAGMKDVREVLDLTPLVPPEVIELCRWTADYYMAGLGDVLRGALPMGSARRQVAFKTERVIWVTTAGLAALATGEAPQVLRPDGKAVNGGPPVGGRSRTRLSGGQTAVLERLAGAGQGMRWSTLREGGIRWGTVERLADKGWLETREARVERDPFPTLAPEKTPDRALTAEQGLAVAELSTLVEARQFNVALVQGVTGSGKTEVYVRVAERAVHLGRRVLVLVPEIALTPATAARFRQAFGSRVAIQHSALSPGERHDQWHRIRLGEVDVVIGTRSAVFSPIDRLGLVIVDEEHDASYKQEETPRYHGRDVAIVRGQMAKALVVLGSATPSMESYFNATSGKYRLMTLARRVMNRPLATVAVVNMRDEFATRGPEVVLSTSLEQAIEARLTTGEQVVVLLNRRGYATSVFCRQCGDTFECPNCSVSLTLHLRGGGASPRGERTMPGGTARGGWGRCHYCNYSMRLPMMCRKCGAPYLEQAGLGTERVEAELRSRFPQARIGRVDRDSVRRKGALGTILGRFASGELDVLVGTQMIAKGHDFPRVTLVGVISADVGLGLADFRAAERTFQILTQVVGRAGRGEQVGEAIVQTLYPSHYSVELAVQQDYRTFFAKELEFRSTMGYPPTSAMINVIVQGSTLAAGLERAEDLARLVREHAGRGITVLGPAPAPMGRLRGAHRVQLFLKGTRRAEMRLALHKAIGAMPELRKQLLVDVDPVNVL